MKAPVADAAQRFAMHLPLLGNDLVAERGHFMAEAEDVLLNKLLAFASQVGFHEPDLLVAGPPPLQFQLDVLHRRQLRRPTDPERTPAQPEPGR